MKLHIDPATNIHRLGLELVIATLAHLILAFTKWDIYPNHLDYLLNLISDAHEWINEIPMVPIYYLAKP